MDEYDDTDDATYTEADVDNMLADAARIAVLEAERASVRTLLAFAAAHDLPAASVLKALSGTSAGVVEKAWDENSHPRDDGGRFVSAGEINRAAADPKRADALRATVTAPEQRKKLDALLASKKPFAANPARPVNEDLHFIDTAERAHKFNGLLTALAKKVATHNTDQVLEEIESRGRTARKLSANWLDAQKKAVAQFRADFAGAPDLDKHIADVEAAFGDAHQDIVAAFQEMADAAYNVAAAADGDRSVLTNPDQPDRKRFAAAHDDLVELARTSQDAVWDAIERARDALGGKEKGYKLGRYFKAAPNDPPVDDDAGDDAGDDDTDLWTPGRVAKAEELHADATDAERLAAAVDIALAALADGTDPQEALDRLHAHDGATVEKANWDESQHPRSKTGQFISRDDIADAKTDPAKAKELRAKVKPADAQKLEDALSGKTDLGTTKKRQAKDAAGAKREAVKANRAKARELRIKLADQESRGEELNPDDLRALIPHLSQMTHEELSRTRAMLERNGATFGGKRLRADRVAALVAWATGKAEAKPEPEPVAAESGSGADLTAAYADWKANRAYIDRRGNYRLKETGQVAPWNRAVRDLYPDLEDFRAAAYGKPRQESTSELRERMRQESLAATRLITDAPASQPGGTSAAPEPAPPAPVKTRLQALAEKAHAQGTPADDVNTEYEKPRDQYNAFVRAVVPPTGTKPDSQKVLDYLASLPDHARERLDQHFRSGGKSLREIEQFHRQAAGQTTPEQVRAERAARADAGDAARAAMSGSGAGEKQPHEMTQAELKKQKPDLWAKIKQRFAGSDANAYREYLSAAHSRGFDVPLTLRAAHLPGTLTSDDRAELNKNRPTTAEVSPHSVSLTDYMKHLPSNDYKPHAHLWDRIVGDEKAMALAREIATRGKMTEADDAAAIKLGLSREMVPMLFAAGIQSQKHRAAVNSEIGRGNYASESALQSHPDLKEKQDWYSENAATYWDSKSRQSAITLALALGKPVPAEVLADYPDLAQRFGAKGSDANSAVAESIPNRGVANPELPSNAPDARAALSARNGNHADIVPPPLSADKPTTPDLAEADPDTGTAAAQPAPTGTSAAAPKTRLQALAEKAHAAGTPTDGPNTEYEKPRDQYNAFLRAVVPPTGTKPDSQKVLDYLATLPDHARERLDQHFRSGGKSLREIEQFHRQAAGQVTPEQVRAERAARADAGDAARAAMSGSGAGEKQPHSVGDNLVYTGRAGSMPAEFRGYHTDPGTGEKMARVIVRPISGPPFEASVKPSELSQGGTGEQEKQRQEAQVSGNVSGAGRADGGTGGAVATAQPAQKVPVSEAPQGVGKPAGRFVSVRKDGRTWEVHSVHNDLGALKDRLGLKHFDTQTGTWVKPGARGPVKDKNARVQYDEVPQSLDHLVDPAAFKTVEQMRQQFARSDDTFTEHDQRGHYNAVKNALALGKPVPAEVLADYPDLAAKYGQAGTNAAPTPTGSGAAPDLAALKRNPKADLEHIAALQKQHAEGSPEWEALETARFNAQNVHTRDNSALAALHGGDKQHGARHFALERLASAAAQAHEAGDAAGHRAATDAVTSLGGALDGPAAGETTTHNPARYDAPAGVFQGDAVKVTRQPVTYNGALVYRGKVEPVASGSGAAPLRATKDDSQAAYDTARGQLNDALGYGANDKISTANVLDAILHRSRGGELPFEFGRIAYAVAMADATGRINGEAANLFKKLNPEQTQHVVATLAAHGVDGNQSDVALWLNKNVDVLRARPGTGAAV